MPYRHLLWMPLFVSTLASAALDPQQIERQFLELVISGHKRPLDPQMHPGCTKNSRTVGEFYSQMMNDFLFGEGGDKKLTLSCAPYDATKSPFKAPKKNETPIECVFEMTRSEAKTALIARISRDGKSLERKYLSCLGAK